MKFLLSLCILLSSSTCVLAQLNAIVVGDAVNQGNNCYLITADEGYQTGGVWYDNPIDFASDFTIFYQNNFGAKDANGADGMALVFKGDPSAIIGATGGGLGYSGITPSLVVEFDTFQNSYNGDPTWDHIAIISNGNPNHNNAATNLAGPIEASATSLNIEDGVSHEVKIEWNATNQVFSVYFDCVLRLSINLDVKSTIFSGDDSVFFGFVASTGGQTNLHQVCFNRISFVDNLQLDDIFICENSSVQVDAAIPSGITYSWTPTTGVSNPSIPNPFLSPTVTTTYTVTISDVCGDTTTEQFTATIVPLLLTEPVFDAIPPICQGDNLAPLPTISNNGVSGTWLPSLDNTQTTTYTFTPALNECSPQTTIEIVVIPTLFPAFTAVSSVCFGEFLAELPTTSNDGITGTWSPSMNNIQTTDYTFTPDAGQGCTTTTTLQINVTPLFIPTFDVVNPICAYEALDDLPTISNEGFTGTWSPTLNNTITTLYSFDADAEQCAADTTVLEIEVIPISQLSITVELISEPFTANQVVAITVLGGTGVYEYQLDDGLWVTNNIFSNFSGCKEYEIKVREASGCSNTAVERFRVLDYPRYFTPNGDAINDFWNIECLKDQSGATITIYDRYGKIVAAIVPSKLGWNGVYNGTLLPSADYWFKADYFTRDGQPRVYRSHFTLKR